MNFKHSIGCLTTPSPARNQDNKGNRGLKGLEKVHRKVKHTSFKLSQCYRIEVKGQPPHGITPRCYQTYVATYSLRNVEGEGEALKPYERRYIQTNLQEAYENPRKNFPDGTFKIESRVMCFNILDKGDWRIITRIYPRGDTYISKNFGSNDNQANAF